MTISAKIIAHSKSSVTGKEIITYELNYPRFIHSELMTHRLFSRNAASSRAIPVDKIIEMIESEPAIPVHWGINQPGMQADNELDIVGKASAVYLWKLAASRAVQSAKEMKKLGLHKQIVNRILEPFQWMKTVVTSTEWDNWYWLRNHPDAQPEIKRLAEVMLEAKQKSTPVTLRPGDWHVPYFGGSYCNGCWINGVENETLEDALAISSSCCAQVSYRKLDDSLEKAKDIFAKLIESKPCHASPTEHQATPMVAENGFVLVDNEDNAGWHTEYEKGVTGRYVDPLTGEMGGAWSGNFRGFVQHRQLIPDNACWNYSPSGDKE